MQTLDADVGCPGSEVGDPGTGVQHLRRHGRLREASRRAKAGAEIEESREIGHVADIYGLCSALSTEHVPLKGPTGADYDRCMYTAHDRIRQAVDASGRSLASISVAAGLHRDTLGKVLAKPDHSPTIETIEKIAQALGASPAWLAYGDRSPHGVPLIPTLPKLGDIAAGVWFEADADRAEVEPSSIAADLRFPFRAQYLLRAVGTSMNRVFPPNDWLHCVDIAAGSISAAPGDIVVVERRRAAGEREVSAKRLVLRNAEPVFVADSSDPQWADYELRPDVGEDDSVNVTAVVIRALRELR